MLLLVASLSFSHLADDLIGGVSVPEEKDAARLQDHDDMQHWSTPYLVEYVPTILSSVDCMVFMQMPVACTLKAG